MNIKIELAYNNKNEITELFNEYTKMLIDNDPSFQKYLDLQNYNDEINHLENKYGLPDGRLYILKIDNKIEGCIGLRKIDNINCEMKRLYIRSAARGNHLSY